MPILFSIPSILYLFWFVFRLLWRLIRRSVHTKFSLRLSRYLLELNIKTIMIALLKISLLMVILARAKAVNLQPYSDIIPEPSFISHTHWVFIRFDLVAIVLLAIQNAWKKSPIMLGETHIYTALIPSFAVYLSQSIFFSFSWSLTQSTRYSFNSPESVVLDSLYVVYLITAFTIFITLPFVAFVGVIQDQKK